VKKHVLRARDICSLVIRLSAAAVTIRRSAMVLCRVKVRIRRHKDGHS
jgi:hypothetical protein